MKPVSNNVAALLTLAALLGIVPTSLAQAKQSALPSAPLPAGATLHASSTLLAQATAPYSASPDSEAAPAPVNTVSLYTVVDLALRNSKAVLASEAEQHHVRASWSETRDAYVPTFSVGSGLGYSYGFPIGGPYLFNVTSNSLLFSFSQHDYIRSARAAWQAATLSLKNTRQQVILDASLKYMELTKTVAQIDALNQALTDTQNMVGIVQQRMAAGLESRIGLTQAQLTEARIHLQEIQTEDRADEIRQHLASLTGLDANSIIPSAASIPPLPSLDFHELMRNGEKSPAVQAAFATALSRKFGASADRKQNYRPTVGMVFQYQLFSTFNGYQQYYLSFQQNNIEMGIQALLPLFDPIRRDKATESKAEAIRAQRDAEQSRIQNDEGNFTMWRNLRELKAQVQVAELEQRLAQDTLASTLTQMNQGSADSNGAPITPQQADEFRMEERTRYVDLQDARFNVESTELNLLNAIGGLEDWAKNGTQSAPDSSRIAPQVIQH